MPNDGYGVSAYDDIHAEYAKQESKKICSDVFEESETIHEMVIQEVKNGAESDEQSDELYNLFILIDELHQIIFCDTGFHGDMGGSIPHNNSRADAAQQTREYGNVCVWKRKEKKKKEKLPSLRNRSRAYECK